MKITKRQLKQIIKEEISKALQEGQILDFQNPVGFPDDPVKQAVWDTLTSKLGTLSEANFESGYHMAMSNISTEGKGGTAQLVGDEMLKMLAQSGELK